MIALGPLVSQTIQEPAKAANRIMSLPLTREITWTGFALMLVLNTIVFQLQILLSPLPEGLVAYASPPRHLIFNTIVQLSVAVAITGVGRWMNGQGNFLMVLAILSWIGFVQTLAMFPVIVVGVVSSALSDLMSLTVQIGALYVLLHFINQVHQLGSLWRAFGVLIMSGVAISLAFIFLFNSILTGQ